MDRPLRLISRETIAESPIDALARTVEALLVVASQPLTVEQLVDATEDDSERVETALGLSKTPPHTVIVKDREQIPGSAADYKTSSAAWFDWDELVADSSPAEPVSVAATDPLYILYTSGTTGKPKGVVRDNGGHAVALTWSMRNIYDIGAGDVWWTASDVGWVVGHSYIVYGPLLAGATTVLYEGKPVGTPDAGAFWRIIAENNVKALFTAPTAIRAVRKADPDAEELAKYSIDSLETLFAAGERLDPDTYAWATRVLERPVVDHWWQTETGWAIAANLRGLDPMPLKAGSPTVPVPGYRVEIVDAHGELVKANTEGNIVVRLPLPPGTLTGLWQDEDRYRRSYLDTFPGYYLTGDSGFVDEDGYVFVLGRSDDVINVAGHRLSTGTMEAVVASHPAVAECSIVGKSHPEWGEEVIAFVVALAITALLAATLFAATMLAAYWGLEPYSGGPVQRIVGDLLSAEIADKSLGVWKLASLPSG